MTRKILDVQYVKLHKTSLHSYGGEMQHSLHKISPLWDPHEIFPPWEESIIFWCNCIPTSFHTMYIANVQVYMQPQH